MEKAVERAGVPVWSHDGIICTGETYKNYVKTTFAKGASLEDPAGLFNSSLEGNTRRAIDFHEGDKIDEKALERPHRRRRGTEHSSASKESEEDEVANSSTAERISQTMARLRYGSAAREMDLPRRGRPRDRRAATIQSAKQTPR